jgi:hypothetical protein
MVETRFLVNMMSRLKVTLSETTKELLYSVRVINMDQ